MSHLSLYVSHMGSKVCVSHYVTLNSAGKMCHMQVEMESPELVLKNCNTEHYLELNQLDGEQILEHIQELWEVFYMMTTTGRLK